MRFLLYDRVDELAKGRYIVGTRTFPLSDDYLEAHFPRRPTVPGTLLIEAMAQLLGWLIIATHDFQLAALVSLVEGVTIGDPGLRPGIAATIRAELVSSSATDSLGTARLEVEGRLVATAERLIYTHVRPVDGDELRARFAYLGGEPRAAGAPRGGAR